MKISDVKPIEATIWPETGTATGTVQRTRWASVIVLSLATLIVASELSMAAFALPLIVADLGVSTRATAWVLLGYSLPLAALAIPAGRWVDRADLRLVFLISLLGVGLASVLAALAPFFWVLLVGRVLQGFAAALYLAIYLPIVAATVREDQRGRAMSYIATLMMLGSAAVTPLGGFVAEAFGWREVFLIKLPLLALVLWLGYRTLPAARTGVDLVRRLPPPDLSLVWEVLLVGSAVTAGLLAFEQIEGRRTVSVGLLIVAVVMGVWWVRLPASQPAVALMRRRAFRLPAISLMLMASIIGLMIFLLPFFIADVMRRGPEILGLAMLFFVGAASVASPIAGTLADRHGPLPVATVGGTLTVAGMLTMLTLVPEADLADLAWRLVVIGVGMALFNSPNMTAILNATPDGQAGIAGGVSSIARTLGTTLGPATASLAWSLGGGGAEGFRIGVLVLTNFALLGVIALLMSHDQDA